MLELLTNFPDINLKAQKFLECIFVHQKFLCYINVVLKSSYLAFSTNVSFSGSQ